MARFLGGCFLLGGGGSFLEMKRREIATSHNFNGRTVLITGGATEVRKATIKKFLQAGAKVQVVEKDKWVLSELQKNYPAITGAAVNSKDDGVEIPAATKFGPIHHFVNVADIEGQPVDPRKMSQEVILRVGQHFHDTYFKHIMNLIQVVRVGTVANTTGGATVVNMVSVVPKLTYVGTDFYNTTNFAVLMLNQAMASALELFGMRLNTVLLTIMDGDFAKATTKDDFDSEGGNGLIKRPLTAEEKADLILSLSSPKSILHSGQTIFVDGSLEKNLSDDVPFATMAKFSL